MSSFMDRIPLVLWSGGLDSTFLLFIELCRGDVDVLEITLNNTYPNHPEAEKVARDAIAERLKELNHLGLLKGVIRTRIATSMTYPDFSFNPGQQSAWVFSAFYSHDPRRHSYLLSGLLLSDSASFSIPGMLKMWESLYELTPKLNQSKYYNKSNKTELSFPLYYSCIDKESMLCSDVRSILSYIGLEGNALGEAYDEWLKLKELTWSCYKPNVKYTPIKQYFPCERCDSCKTRSLYSNEPTKSIFEELKNEPCC